MDRLDRSNINGAYNHKDYKYIITRNLLSPNVTQKGCWTTVFCEKGYSLYILDGTGGGNVSFNILLAKKQEILLIVVSAWC